MLEVSSLVLRFSKSDDEYFFRVAKIQSAAISTLSDKISQGDQWEKIGVFGPPLNLSQAMHEIDTRDFAVVDVKAGKPEIC